MIQRNALCPCGSGKKHKKCCLLLSQSIKAKTTIRMGEQGLVSMISVLAHNSIKNMRDAKCNQGKSYGLKDFKMLLNMACALWNISFLPARRSKELTTYIEQNHYRNEVNRMISDMRKSTIYINKLMIAAATAKNIQSGKYPIEFEVYKLDLEFIEENIQETVNQIIEAVNFMIENSPKKETK